MVLMASQLSSAVYEVFNEKAEPIGYIHEPIRPGLTGLGAGTVYLQRPLPLGAVRAGASPGGLPE